MCSDCTMAGRQPGQWLQLPSNLWAEAFSRVSSRSAGLPSDVFSRQSCFFQLRLVCQTFNKVFEQHRHLNSNVFVHDSLQSCHLLSLTEWLQHHQADVKFLDVRHDSPWLEVILMALRSPHTCLEKVDVGVPVTKAAICLLSSFQSITECVLQSKLTFSLDLRPLSALPLLTRLYLQHGLFSGLEAASHLTVLSILDADVTCFHDCRCVASLLKLILNATRLMRFHHRNVAACSKLQSLTLIQSSIGVDNEQNFNLLHQDSVQVPPGLSALTALTSLRLNFLSPQVLGWVTALSALQTFAITANKVEFPLLWNNMTNVRSLVVDNHSVYDWDPQQSNAIFEFDWSKLMSLEILKLNNLVLSETTMSGLASLPNLQAVELDNVRPIDVHTASQIATVAFEIGQQRRNIRFEYY